MESAKRYGIHLAEMVWNPCSARYGISPFCEREASKIKAKALYIISSLSCISSTRKCCISPTSQRLHIISPSGCMESAHSAVWNPRSGMASAIGGMASAHWAVWHPCSARYGIKAQALYGLCALRSMKSAHFDNNYLHFRSNFTFFTLVSPFIHLPFYSLIFPFCPSFLPCFSLANIRKICKNVWANSFSFTISINLRIKMFTNVIYNYFRKVFKSIKKREKRCSN